MGTRKDAIPIIELTDKVYNLVNRLLGEDNLAELEIGLTEHVRNSYL